MKEIPLTQGKVALVDDDDYTHLNYYSWHVLKDKPNKNRTPHYYAATTIDGTNILMHRLILCVPNGNEVDHINGDGLDNRKENIRIVTRRQNQQNQHAAKSSVYTGVCWHKREKKWISNIDIKGVKIHLGYFEHEKEASEAYINACKMLIKDVPITI